MNFNYNLYPGRKKIIKYKNTKSLISIITPFYNSGNFIEQTAKSVLNQTFPDYEWIIVDDGSTDEDSLKLLNKIKELDSRIKVYHKSNGGLAETRDFGASKSSEESKYLVFLDDDDLINETFLECGFWTLETNNTASWAYVDTVNFGQESYIWKKWFDTKREKKENLLVAMAMIRKSDFNKVNGYELREKAVFEDWNLWLKMMSNGMYPVRMSFPGFWYRRKEKYLSELNRSTKNKKNAMKYIEMQASKIKKDIIPIQYPRYHFNKINVENIILEPKYECNLTSKNILMFFPWIVVGGADKFNIELIKGLQDNGYTITVITTEPQNNELRQEMEEYATVYDLTTFLNQDYWLNFIEYIIKKNDINNIFISNSKFAYSIIKYIKQKYENINIFDYIHMNESNNIFFDESNRNKEYITKTYFCNNFTKDEFIFKYKINNKEKYETTYIGVDTQKFNPNKYDKKQLLDKYKLNENDFYLLYICRLENQKKPLLMLEILKQLIKKQDNVKLLVVGDGSQKKNMEKFINKNKLKKYVLFYKNTFDVEEFYIISDVLINCSSNEGIPLTTYEAIAMNLPIIASNVGGESEIITKNNGILINNITCIYDYIDAILKIYDKKFIIDEKSRLDFVKKYDISNMKKKFVKEFDKYQNIKLEKDKKTQQNNFDINSIEENIKKYKDEYIWQINVFNNIYLDKGIKKKLKIKNFIIKILKKIHVYNTLRNILKGEKDNG